VIHRLGVRLPARRRLAVLAVAAAGLVLSPLIQDARASLAADRDSTDNTIDVVDSSDLASPTDDAVKKQLRHGARRARDSQPVRSGTTLLQGSPRHRSSGFRGPLISVVIPTHDRADLLRGAIESVKASPLIQSPRQIVVVDDDSHDHTCDVARQLGVTYLRVACHSAAGSRNAGLAVSHTPYVSFLDDDDVWLSGNMEAQLGCLESRPDAGFAYGMAQPVSDELEPIHHLFPVPPLPSGRVPDKLHLSYPQLGVVLFRRQALAEVGGFDTRIRYYEDGDLMSRVAARHEIVGLELVGMLYRERPPSKARADYFWAEARRELTRWRPKQAGISWLPAARFRFRAKGLFCGRFFNDAAACAGLGARRDTLVCVARAVRISPVHALRHSAWIPAILRQYVRGRRASQALVAVH
jgi:glycosyltransferase involved in cell wall biosynthesis